MAKTTQHNYAAKLKVAILNAAITGKLTSGTNGWKTVKLGEISKFFSGNTPNKELIGKSGIPYFKVAEMNLPGNEIFLINTSQFIENSQKVRTFPKGTIVFPKNGGAVLTNKKRILQQESVCDLNTGGLLPASNVRNDYFFLWFSSIDLARYVKGSALPTIERKKLCDTDFPLPPLAVQKEIVGKVEELMGLVEVVRKGDAKIRELGAKARAKILDLAIHGKLVAQDPADPPPSAPAATTTPPYPIPPNWKWVTLGEICDYGKCSSIQASEIRDDVWSLDLEDIEKDTGKLLSKIRFGERKAKGTRHIFKKGQLLYSKLRTYLNKVLVADEDGVCTTEILPLDFTEEVSPSYARLVLMSQMALDYTVNCGYGVKMPRLGTHDGKRMPFPLPPLAEQRRIVAKVEALLAAVETLTLRAVSPAEGVHH